MSNQTAELFKLDGKVGFAKALPISLQHIFAMIVANVAPVLIVANGIGLDQVQTTEIIQYAMFSAGVATLLQVVGIWRFGAKLPLIMGMNFAFVPVCINIGNSYGLPAVYGSIIIAGFVTLLFGAAILKVRRFFPPLVSGTTVLTMGLSLYPVAINYMAGGQAGDPGFGSLQNWSVALLTLILVLLISHLGKGYVRLLGMLIGIAVAYVLAYFLGMVDLSSVSRSSWIAYPKLFPFGISFVPEAIITMVVMYIVTSVEVIGDISSLTIGAFNREPSTEELSGGLMGKGIIAVLTATLGAMPTASFSQNIGIVTMTKVVAKRVFYWACGIMILIGFLPKFGVLMRSIPNAVLGGATLSVFAIITINGIRLVSEAKMTARNATILGISLAFGLGLTSVPEAVALAPEAFKTFIASSPVIISTVICFLLNLLLPKEDEQ